MSAIDHEVYLSSSSLARLFFRIRLTNPNDVPKTDHQALEKRLQEAARSWVEATAAAIEAWKPGRKAADSHQPGQMRLVQPTEPITQ